MQKELFIWNNKNNIFYSDEYKINLILYNYLDKLNNGMLQYQTSKK